MTRVNSGTKFEYLVKSYLEKQGMFVLRSAGSHSPIDLVAWDHNKLFAIQCKKETVKRDYKLDVLALLKIPMQKHNWHRMLWIKNGTRIDIIDLDTGHLEIKTLKELNQ